MLIPQKAGYPHVLPLGTFAFVEDGQNVQVLCSVGEPRWNLRLPHFYHPPNLEPMVPISPPKENLCILPTGFRPVGKDLELCLPVVLLELDTAAAPLPVNDTVATTLSEAVSAMTLLFSGYRTSPASNAWAGGDITSVVFPGITAALSFCTCLQLMLNYAPWDPEVPPQPPYGLIR